MHTCPICKNGELQPGVVIVTFERGDSIVLLKNITARVCNNCESYLLDSQTTRRALDKAENALKNGAELEILQLQTL